LRLVVFDWFVGPQRNAQGRVSERFSFVDSTAFEFKAFIFPKGETLLV